MNKVVISSNTYSTVFFIDGETRLARKELNQDFPDRRTLRRIDNEFSILKELEDTDIPGVRRTRGREKEGARHYILFDYFEGLTLKEAFDEPQSLDLFLKVAINLATVIHEIHRAGIVHRDVTSNNLLVHLEDCSVCVIDFELATRIDLKRPYLGNPERLEGTLPYISPEQTGRINRVVDHRSDLYSLGVVFYRALTGQLPFQATDALELVHCHIARIPEPPRTLRPEIPQVLSDIVMKLLEKNAESRYTSAFGLRRDLEACLERLTPTGEIDAFPLGLEDHSDRFQIPEKLYGRSEETRTLLEAFERVSQGTLELMLVSGYSGTGKTALISETHKPVSSQHGYFVDGKFDQFKRNIPYYAFLRTFEQFIELILTEEEETLKSWSEKIQAAVGSEGAVLTDVLPTLKQVIGPQQPVPDLAGKEAQNRFNYVFRNFVKTISREEHPLVLFIDDLQWADSGSLDLLRLLATDPDNKYLMCVCAYRDNEVSASHPFVLATRDIEDNGIPISRVHLENLSLENVNELIADSLLTDTSRTKALSALVYEKTQGNAFFLRQFLRSLYENGHLTYDFEGPRWVWDVASIRSLNMTDNVVELLAAKIQKLSSGLREVLRLGACIGDRFERTTLELVFEGATAELYPLLEKAMMEGLLVPINEETLRFTHDRVQQAAYSLIAPEERPALHLKIGRLFLDKISEEEREEHLFDIVNQLNWGVDLMTNQAEREELAQLNLDAGRKAKESAAYAPAYEYLATGIRLLPKNSWQTHYALTLALHTEAAEACYLGAEFERMDALIEVVFSHAENLIDKVKTYETRILAFKARNMLVESIDSGLDILQGLGIELPTTPTPEDTGKALQETMALLADYTVDELLDLPEMTDPAMRGAMAIMADINSSVYWARAELFPFIVFKTVELSVKYGNSPVSSFAYSTYGVVLAGVVGDMRTANAFGELGLKVLERFHAIEWMASTVCAHYVLIVPWNEHVRDAFGPLVESVHRGLETGSNEYAAINANNYLIMAFCIGTPLDALAEELASYSAMMLEYKQETNYRFNQIYLQAIQNLQGLTENPCVLVGEAYNETDMLPRHLEAKDYTAAFQVYFMRMILNYLFGDIEAAEQARLLASERVSAILAKIENAPFRMYDSLILLAQYSDAEPERQVDILTHVEQNQTQMAAWADAAPMNFRHKHCLVEAERHRVLGDSEKAHALYEKAATLANQHDYLNEEALIYELCGEFFRGLGLPIVGRRYLYKAFKVYRQWEAHAKAADLLARYPDIQPKDETTKVAIKRSSSTTTTTKSSTMSGGWDIDFESLTKAARAISQEIDISKLLENTMRILLENAGADRGVLVLSHGEDMVVEVEVDAEGRCVRPRIQLEQYEPVARSVTEYVLRTSESVVLDNAGNTDPYRRDPHIQETRPQSLLCSPLRLQNQNTGLIYLENHATSGAFTADRVQIVQTLSSQAAISLENAGLYANLEDKVQERTRELSNALEELKHTQSQLVLSEKMASLGTLVAGVAHELNNPVNFTNTSAENMVARLQSFQNLIKELVGEDPDNEVVGLFKDQFEPLKNNLSVILDGSKRIKEIVHDLRSFSSLDEAEQKRVTVEEGLARTLTLVQVNYRKRIRFDCDFRANIEIDCWPGQLSQVFLNIMVNACQAIIAQQEQKGDTPKGVLTLRTFLEKEHVVIQCEDTGIGMSNDVIKKVYEPFFTTKEVGEGTGLGMSISYSIIERHQGCIDIDSTEGQGTTVSIYLPISSNT